MADLVSLHAFVFGRVQGTFFRAFVRGKANGFHVTGYVRNMPDGSVEVFAEGERKVLDQLIAYLHIGPPAARVEKVVEKWAGESHKYSDFSIKY